jgi:hypothetical protein
VLWLFPHVGDRFSLTCRRATGSADASIVEHDHAMFGGVAVNDARIPVVHHGSEVDEEDHRCARLVRAELSIRELDSTGSDRACGHILPTDAMVLKLLMPSSPETRRLRTDSRRKPPPCLQWATFPWPGREPVRRPKGLTASPFECRRPPRRQAQICEAIASGSQDDRPRIGSLAAPRWPPSVRYRPRRLAVRRLP